MKNTIRILAVLLVLQLGAATYLLWQNHNVSSTTVASDLFDFQPETISKLSIQANDESDHLTEVVLVRQNQQWILPSLGDFPAQQNSVQQVLNTLQSAKRGLPVANSGNDFERFRVAEHAFERHLKLYQDDKTVVDLYVGHATGARESYVRLANEKAVYAINLGVYDLPLGSDKWENKTALKLDTKTVRSLQIGDMQFTRPSGEATQWQMANLSEDKQLDQAALENLTEKLATLNYRQVLGKESKPNYGLAEPVFKASLGYNKQQQRTYQLGQLKDSNDYILKVSDRPEYFQIASYVGKPLLESADSAKLLLKRQPAAQDAMQTLPEPAAAGSAPVIQQDAAATPQTDTTHLNPAPEKTVDTPPHAESDKASISNPPPFLPVMPPPPPRTGSTPKAATSDSPAQ